MCYNGGSYPMNENRELALPSDEPPTNTRRPETVERPDGVSLEFWAKLGRFPLDIQEAVASLSPPIRAQIFGRPEAKSLSTNSTAEISRILQSVEADRIYLRHEYESIWEETEIDSLDRVDRETVTRNTLGRFLRDVNIRDSVTDNPAAVGDIMDSLWRNRGKKGPDVEPYRREHFDNLRRELDVLQAEKQAIIDELNKLGAKKSLNRRESHRQDELGSILALNYDNVWYASAVRGKGNPYSTPEKQRHINELTSGIQSGEKELGRQRTLAFVLPYMDATDCAVTVMETVCRELYRFQRRDSALIRKIAAQVDEWYERHQYDPALKQALQKDASREVRQQKLAEHFWRLFKSYDRLTEEPNTEPSRLENTAREIIVVLHLLDPPSR